MAPSVKFGIGEGLSTAKSGLTLTINPKLLEKMQNDPSVESEMKDLIKGVESATKLVESVHKANGSTTVYRHGYIDVNGKYWSCAYTVKKDPVNGKLRKKAKEDTEKHIEKVREHNRKKAKELAEKLEKRRKRRKRKKRKKPTSSRQRPSNCCMRKLPHQKTA